MSRKVLYQTVQDRGNPEFVLSDGPFLCSADNAWLGHGYYFWDTMIHLAHLWGERKLKQPYIICKAICNFDSSQCFDLVGEPEHMELFSSIVEMMDREGLIDDDTVVAHVIWHLKNKLGIFHWKATRVIGVLSFTFKSYETLRYRMYFEKGQKQFLDFKPPIQICLYEKDALEFKDYEIVYPEKYNPPAA